MDLDDILNFQKGMLELKKRGIQFGPTLPTLREVEAALMREALRRTEGNVLKAAKLIETSKTTMYRRLPEFIRRLDAEV